MELIIITDEGGDWEAVYINRYLIDEGHSIDWHRFIFDNLYYQKIERVVRYELDFEFYGRARAENYFNHYNLDQLKLIESKG